MNAITALHVAAGVIALCAGTLAFALRKGSSRHGAVGRGFCLAMLVLGITAAILEPMKSPPGSPIGGLMVCYFVATAWMTARRHNGVPGHFEKIACAVALLIAAAMIAGGVKLALAAAAPRQPPGPFALFAVGGICLVAGLLDLRFIVRGRLSTTQRLTRHLWRMAFAFFIATGSFFLGQQDVLPEPVRGSPILWVLAFAPFALMLFWLVRVRFSKHYKAK